MLEQPGDVALALVGEMVGVSGIEHDISLAREEGLMHMHAAAVLAEDGFGHEAGVVAVPSGDLLDCDLVSHDRIGHGQCIFVAQVDLMLGWSNLMVAVFYIYAHGVQSQDGVPPQIRGIVRRGQVEVSSAVQYLRAVLGFEIEELQLRADQEAVAFILEPGQVSLQDVSGISLVGAAVGILDVAEHPGYRVFLLPPGNELEGGGIGLGHHIRFVDAGKALDGGAVEAHALGECSLQLGGIDGEALGNTQDISKPNSDKSNIVFVYCLKDLIFCLYIKGHFNLAS